MRYLILQVVGIFAGFGVLLLVASPFLLLAAPCILCCKCKLCKCCEEDDDVIDVVTAWSQLFHDKTSETKQNPTKKKHTCNSYVAKQIVSSNTKCYESEVCLLKSSAGYTRQTSLCICYSVAEMECYIWYKLQEINCIYFYSFHDYLIRCMYKIFFQFYGKCLKKLSKYMSILSWSFIVT